MILLAVSVVYDNEYTNKINYTENITVSGKICNDKVFGTTISKIQDSNGKTYFVDNEVCPDIIIGESAEIIYNRVRQASNENFVHCRVVEYGGRGR